MTPRRLPASARAVAAVLLCFAAAGCNPSQSPGPIGEPRPGLHLTGTVGGRHVAVADARPDLVMSDCDPRGGDDDDVCFISRDLTGELVVLVFENPEVLQEGAVLDVGPVDCSTPQRCDAATDVAIVDLQVAATPRRRATGGTLTLGLVEPGLRYRGELLLRFDEGRVSGAFDVVPRPD